MRILVTGGHLGPALSIIEKLPKNTQILFVGRKYTFEGDKSLSFEYKTARNLKIPFREINTGRWQRTFTRYTIGSFLKFPIGLLQSLNIAKEFKPDVIVSFGGYVSLPIVLAGAMLGIPIVIHEQTFTPGIANRLASFFASKICISWNVTQKYFPAAKTILTGNPIRKLDTKKLSFKIPEERIPLLYITGGSAGSHTINLVIMRTLEELVARFRIIHQTGDSWDFHDFNKLEKIKNNLNPKFGKRYVVTKFIDAREIGTIYKTADLVIGRGGMNTITELIYFNKPAILIPINDEQKENAIFFKRLGLGEVLLEEYLNKNNFLEKVNSMIKNYNKYKKSSKNSDTYLIEHASNKILEVILNEIAKKRAKK